MRPGASQAKGVSLSSLVSLLANLLSCCFQRIDWVVESVDSLGIRSLGCVRFVSHRAKEVRSTTSNP